MARWSCGCSQRLRRRTPGPPPFSSRNSTPADSSTPRTARSFAAVRSSERIGAIAAALAKVQAELTNPGKSLVATIRGPEPHTPCMSPAVRGKRRCRMHGGAAGSGAPRGE